MKTNFGSLLLLSILTTGRVFGQQLDVGIRLQKAIGLYTENGLTVQYTHPKLASERLYVGFSYVTSRLGSALNSNAISQDNFLASVSYHFRPQRVVRPVLRANVGYFLADLGDPIFDQLPHTSLLASPEFGLCYCPRIPLKVYAGIGYNLLSGDGISGPGTLYPVFVQTSITWNILKKAKN